MSKFPGNEITEGYFWKQWRNKRNASIFYLTKDGGETGTYSHLSSKIIASVASTALEATFKIYTNRVGKGNILVQGHDNEVAEILASVKSHLLAAEVEELLQGYNGQEAYYKHVNTEELYGSRIKGIRAKMRLELCQLLSSLEKCAAQANGIKIRKVFRTGRERFSWQEKSLK